MCVVVYCSCVGFVVISVLVAAPTTQKSCLEGATNANSPIWLGFVSAYAHRIYNLEDVPHESSVENNVIIAILCSKIALLMCFRIGSAVQGVSLLL